LGKEFRVESADALGSSLRVLIAYSGIRLGSHKDEFRIALRLDNEREIMVSAESESSRLGDSNRITVIFMRVSRGVHAVSVSLLDDGGKTIILDRLCKRV